MSSLYKLKIILGLLALNLYFSFGLLAQKNQGRVTVVLSLDGFRWDYPEKVQTPNIHRIAGEGVRAKSLIPSFPSKTFPNHYTIATGLVPDHHGLVNNSFYDRELGRSYAMVNKEARFDPAFYGGEPIWITAHKQHVRTASYNWVGSDVAIQGIYPDYWKDYDGGVSFSRRSDTIIKWLSLPDTVRPRLIMAYYHEPDGVGHEYGPDDPRTFAMIRQLDSLVGILYNRIRALPAGNDINFILTSDHGMGTISSERNIALRDFIPEKWPVQIEGGNPNFNIYADPSWIDSVYLAMHSLQHIHTWRPSEIPAHLHYGANPRVGDLVVLADSSWSITLNKPKNPFTGGTHGYDIDNTDMHAVFIASGPAFRESYRCPSFSNIHIYSLLAHILGIVPAKTDGNIEAVRDMLR